MTEKGITVILSLTMRYKYSSDKSRKLKSDPKRGISFAEAQEIWTHPHYEDFRKDDPEQFRVIGWVQGTLYSLIYEIRYDDEGEYFHLVTLWKSTKQERKLYEQNS